METLNNDTFFQSFVEEFADKQVLLINKNKKNIVICYDLWECIERGETTERNTEAKFHVSPIQENLRRVS
jgi:hypothetical protein